MKAGSIGITGCNIWIDAPCWYEVRRLIAIIKANIAYKISLPQHIRTSAQVVHEWSCHWPPGGIYVNMFSGMISKPWFASYCRVVGKVVKDNLVKTGTKCYVKKLLKIRCSLLPVRPARKRLTNFFP